MKGYILFLPYQYGFHTRAKTKVHKISFIALIVVPILLNICLMTKFSFNFMAFIVSFSAMYMTYEIGYIENDVFTTKKEIMPTRWLPEEMRFFVEKYYVQIILSRVICIFLLILLMKKKGVNNLNLFCIALIGLSVAYIFHNSIRGPLNVITDAALNIFKYSSCLIIFSTNIETFVTYGLFLIFEIVAVRTFEFGTEREYIFKNLGGKECNFDRNRVIYYLVLTIGSFLLSLKFKCCINLAIISCYLLVYRVICYYLIHSNEKVQNDRKRNSSK